LKSLQPEIAKKIVNLLDKAKASNHEFPHTLLIGGEWESNETLARYISIKLGSKAMCTSGAAIDRAGDLIGILTNLQEKDVLFIRDFQAMSKSVVDFIQPAIAECKIDFVVDKGPYAKTIKFALQRFTLIASIPDETVLEKRFKDLFFCVYRFDDCSKDDLRNMITKQLESSGMKYDENTIDMLAEKSGNNLGLGMQLVKKVVKYVQMSQMTSLTEEVLKEYYETSEHNLVQNANPLKDRMISSEVRRKVWRRDDGKCVKCGSREKLEYDHIIPISKGGSNTARNIELLCEKCNREKSADIR
jgi:Holliday junction DNA helicase RuvB